MRQLYTFVIRVLSDDDDETLRGQVSEPASADQWRASFGNGSELWAKLKERLGKRSPSPDDQLSSQEKLSWE